MNTKLQLAACLPLLLLLLGCTVTPNQPVHAIPKNAENPIIYKPSDVKSAQAVQQNIPDEIKELFNKSSKIKSIYYKYRGPQTGANFFEFYLKGSIIKYEPFCNVRALDEHDSYDFIFIDTSAKTAQAYCEAAYCANRGKKKDLEYADVYITTIFDWTKGIIDARKIGEEIIDDRNTWKIETNNGIMWVDTFYGIPLKVESGGKTFRYQQIAVNSLQDSDVMPSI